jgi:hypothetical protein
MTTLKEENKSVHAGTVVAGNVGVKNLVTTFGVIQ